MAHPSLHMSKCHNVGNLVPRLIIVTLKIAASLNDISRRHCNFTISRGFIYTKLHDIKSLAV